MYTISVRVNLKQVVFILAAAIARGTYCPGSSSSSGGVAEVGTSEINAGKMASEIREELFPTKLLTFLCQLQAAVRAPSIRRNRDIETMVREFCTDLTKKDPSDLSIHQVIADTIQYAKKNPMLLSEGTVLKFDIDALRNQLDIARIEAALRVVQIGIANKQDDSARKHLISVISLLLLAVPDGMVVSNGFADTSTVGQIKSAIKEVTELNKLDELVGIIMVSEDAMEIISANLKDPDHAEKIIDGLRRLGGHTSTLGCVEAMDQLANHKLPELAVDAVGKFIVRDPQKLESLPSAEAVARRSARRS